MLISFVMREHGVIQSRGMYQANSPSLLSFGPVRAQGLALRPPLAHHVIDTSSTAAAARSLLTDGNAAAPFMRAARALLGFLRCMLL